MRWPNFDSERLHVVLLGSCENFFRLKDSGSQLLKTLIPFTAYDICGSDLRGADNPMVSRLSCMTDVSLWGAFLTFFGEKQWLDMARAVVFGCRDEPKLRLQRPNFPLEWSSVPWLEDLPTTQNFTSYHLLGQPCPLEPTIATVKHCNLIMGKVLDATSADESGWTERLETMGNRGSHCE